jgi:hypothetical protein
MATPSEKDIKIGKSGLIIYDGACGACSFFIGERRPFFEKYGFSLAPLQAEWIQDLTGVDDTMLLQSIHLVAPDGKIYRGADFFHYLSGKVWWLLPIHFILKVPLIRRLFNKLYDYIALRRKSLSKICGLQSRAKYP